MTKSDNTSSKGSGARVVIYCRIARDIVAGLDQIRESMQPTPSRAQLIDLACGEYVKRHGKAERRAKAGA